MTAMPAWLRSLLVAVVLLAMAAAAMKFAFDSREKSEPAAEVETVTAVRAMMVSPAPRRPLLFLPGEVRARDYAVLTAPLSADVLKVSVVEGDYVAAGRRLLVFDLREFDLTRRRQQADMTEIELRLDALRRDKKSDAANLEDTARLLQLAEKNYLRNKELLGGGAVSEVQTESSEQAYRQRRLEYAQMQNQLANYETREKTAQAQMERAKAQLAQTDLLIERGRLLSPFAGRIARIHTAAGQRPAAGAPLLEIFNPKKMRLRIALPQRHAAGAGDSLLAVLRRADAHLTLAFDGMEPRVDDGGSVDVFFALPGGDWVVGATHEIRLELPPQENLIAVPVDAIYNDDRIYRIGEDGRTNAEFCRRAGLGLDGDETAALLSCPGLTGESRIVANQLPQLANRAKVEVIE
ncbi:MAG: efflux RND transporter periplasmic adaptor subunit [Gammaproteobacteria bacterium]